MPGTGWQLLKSSSKTKLLIHREIRPPLYSGSRPARTRGAIRGYPEHCQPGDCRRAVRRAGAVRQGHRYPDRGAVQSERGGLEPAHAAAGRMGRIWPFQHRGRHLDCALRRPAGTSPAPLRSQRLFSAHPGAAGRISRRYPFRPAHQGDAAGHRFAVGPVGRFLSRPSVQLPHVLRAAAALAFDELAPRPRLDRAHRRIRRAHRLDHASLRKPADPGGGALFRARRARLRHGRETSRWCTASPGSRPRCRVSRT